MIRLITFLTLADNVLSDLSLLLLHTNDMHSRFQQTDQNLRSCLDDTFVTCYGGFARLHATVKKLKEESRAMGKPTIFLDAGDSFQGTSYYTNYKWPIVAKFMDALGLDVIALGNHEFDDGISGLAPYISNVKVPVVCCNLDISKEPALQNPNLRRSKVITVNETTVGIIGYLTPNMSKSLIGNTKILDEITSIRHEAQYLKKKGVNIIIALGHSGYEKDLQIAREVEEIDVVVGGHSHSFLYTGSPPDIEKPTGSYPSVVTQHSGKKVPVVQVYYGTKYLGKLFLDFNSEGNLVSFSGSPILLEGNLPQSHNILKLLAPYEKALISKTRQILGYTNVVLSNDEHECYRSECNMGNLITDAYVEYVTDHCQSYGGWTVAAIGITQAGSIRASIKSATDGRNGSITMEDVITAVPFGNSVVVLRLLGSEILEALEYSVIRYDYKTIDKEFLQISGMRVTYDMNQIPGKRVVGVKVLCSNCKMPRFEPLVRSRNYGVVMPEFLANGGDGFSLFEGHVAECKSVDKDYMIISQYIQNYSPLNRGIESRIVLTKTISLKTIFILIVSCVAAFLVSYFIGAYLCNVYQSIPCLLFRSKRRYNRGFNTISRMEEHDRLILENE